MLDPSILSKAYLKRRKIAQHQLDSFNYFLNEGMSKVIEEQSHIETSISAEDEDEGKYTIGVKFGKIRDLSITGEITEFEICRTGVLGHAASAELRERGDRDKGRECGGARGNRRDADYGKIE
jgi:DNA-directed RNA polymerase beta subunit